MGGNSWVATQRKRGNKARVTRWVLFPAALYGQLDILKSHLNDGEIQQFLSHLTTFKISYSYCVQL